MNGERLNFNIFPPHPSTASLASLPRVDTFPSRGRLFISFSQKLEQIFRGGYYPPLKKTIILLFLRIALIKMNDIKVLRHIESVRAAITVDFVASVVHSKADKSIMLA